MTAKSSSDYQKVFHRLSHFIALSKDGKTEEAIDHLVKTIFVLDSNESYTQAHEIADAIDGYFGLRLNVHLIQESLDRLQKQGILQSDPSKNCLRVADQIRANIEERIEDAARLEEEVRQEWLESIENRLPGATTQFNEPLWQCLTDYMSKAFRRHGAETLRLLSTDVDIDGSDFRPLSTFLHEAITRNCNNLPQDEVKECIRDFFRTSTPQRTKYLVQLLDGTFTFFALTIDDATARYLRESIYPLNIFLDTNFIFGILELHSNPFVQVSKELIDIIRSNSFPFTLYYHEETLDEIQRTIRSIGARLKSQKWQSAISRAVLRTASLSGIELRFHEINANTPIDPDTFLSKYGNGLTEILKDYGFKIYRDSYRSSDEEEAELETKINRYEDFILENRNRPKSYITLRHDIVVWETVNRLRRKGDSILDVGAVFLTADHYFFRFDWEYLSGKNQLGIVVLPNHFLQILRPLVPATENFDRRFVETFAIPKFRSINSEFTETQGKIITILNTYSDISEETAVRILSNSMLTESLKNVDASSQEFAEAIESALARDNELLLEEKEALKREKEEALKRAALEERMRKKTEEELKQIEEEKEAAESLAQEKKLQASQKEQRLRELQRELQQKDKSLQKLAEDKEKYDRYLRLMMGTIVAISGLILIFILPHWLDWRWLNDHQRSLGLKASALLALAGLIWAIFDKDRLKWSLGAVVLGAALVFIQLL